MTKNAARHAIRSIKSKRTDYISLYRRTILYAHYDKLTSQIILGLW